MGEGRASADLRPDRAVDLDVIRRLHDDVGRDRAITGDLLGSYARRAPELAAALETATAPVDSDAVRRIAHDLRSMSAFVGAESIVALATELETGDWSTERLIEATRAVAERLPVVLDELNRFADSL